MVPVLSITTAPSLLKDSIETTALEQDAFLGAGTDTGEECQRYAKYKGAGTAHYQEGNCGVNPVMPVSTYQGRNDGSMTSCQDNDDKACILLENLVIKRSIFGLLAAAFSTESRIRVTIDSDNGFSTRIFSCPEVFTQPEVISSTGIYSQPEPAHR